MEAIIEKQPVSAVETPQVSESFVPATSIETSVDTLPSGNQIAQPNEASVAVAQPIKKEIVSTSPILGYMSVANLENSKDLTPGEIGAALAAQKALHVNIEDLPLAV